MPSQVGNIAQNTGALILGLFAGCAVNMALISLNSNILYPPDSQLNLDNMEDFKTYIASLPSAAFGTVFAAHWSQTVVGGYVFALYASASLPPSIATQTMAALTMTGSILNIRALPAPAWTWLEVPIHPILAYLVASTLMASSSDQGSTSNSNNDISTKTI